MKRTLALCALTLLAAPLAFADQDTLGVPDPNCQDDLEKDTHDYNMDPPETGVYASLATPGVAPQGHWPGADHRPSKYMWPYMDGNAQWFCAFSTWLDHDSQECADLEAANPTAHHALCHDPAPTAFDGDLEFGYVGRALLVASNGNWVTNGGPVCYGTEAHHTVQGSIYVTDLVFENVIFSVVADFTDPLSPVPPGEKDCGDGVVQPCDFTPPDPSGNDVIDAINWLLYELFNTPGLTCTPGDNALLCLNHCTPYFPPGIDGAYHVRVGATSDGGPENEPTGATQGHVYSP